jgi:hypothetical protein
MRLHGGRGWQPGLADGSCRAQRIGGGCCCVRGGSRPYRLCEVASLGLPSPARYMELQLQMPHLLEQCDVGLAELPAVGGPARVSILNTNI